ncbi:MAG TPA: zinc-binding dehydrogenase [Ornithinimicrobium sp.]|uniref:zinc-binding dehydrogenase n=1 Tax=Ornithinimicrobium sp. TaxID=1977084 RepID=UPI002B4845C0|nr:zinc-binding dehydrogenase [Ornithinimicrobium sp.]HKJ12765.1 zinc-binding dehydrogenase [Ornithinimicrobium sp.]
MPTSTRAAVLTHHGGPEALTLESSWQVRDPGEGEVLVRVSAAGVNNTDLWTRQGAYGVPGDPDAKSGGMGPIDFPRVQGGDVAGVVVAAGHERDETWVDRRVLVDPAAYGSDGPDAMPVGYQGSEYDGGFAGYMVARTDHVHDVHDSPLSDEELACLPVAFGTAARMLRRADVSEHDTVLVTGASGGVGVALVQLADAAGATVVAVTTAAKRDAVLEVGAHHTVCRDEGEVADLVGDLVPDGLDVVADVVGGPGLGDLLPRVRDDGCWVIAGAIAGPVVELDLRRLYLHSIRLVGSSMHSPRDFAHLAELARGGSVRPPIAARYRLEEIHEAQEAFASSRHVGKIVLLPHA